MKTTRFFAASLALLSVLSCQKEEQQVINNSENEGGAIITCTFAANDAATKTTTTDGKTPLWAAGDKIMIYDPDNINTNTKTIKLVANGTSASADQGEISVDNRSFTFTKPDGWGSEICAIYPSSAFSYSNSDGVRIKFESKKDMTAGQDVTFGKANICAAKTSTTTMSFKNVGAILKFESKSVKATKVVVPVAGLANNFKVTFSGTTPSLVSESASNSNEFSIGDGSGAIYIGVPSGEIAASSVFTYKTSADATLGTYTTGAANTVEANKIYNLGAMMGTLSGLFTVDGSGNKVQFSKGNLQATVDASGKPTAWNFAANQYGYIGNAVANTSIGKTAGVVDLFGWSTSSTSYGVNKSGTISVYSGNFVDWGANAIANGGNTANQWSTLSSAEWTYLLNTDGSLGRTDANRFAKAMVNSVKGLIIFPDGYAGTTSGDGIAAVNAPAATYPTSSIADATWSAMESAGCVFLPAAGYRSGYNMSGVGNKGYCWSSTPNGDEDKYAYRLRFQGTSVDPALSDWRSYSCSVRLVCAAQ